MELDPVHVPGDLGSPPVARGTIPLNPPRVPVLVRHADVASLAVRLVARAAGIAAAVHGAVPPQVAVDGLQDVKLTAGGPATAVAELVAEKPEGRPDTSLLVGGVAAKADVGLGDGLLARGGRKGVGGLDTAGDPVAVAVLLAPGDDLEGVATADLDGSGGGRIRLELVVDVELAVDDIPAARVG